MLKLYSGVTRTKASSAATTALHSFCLSRLVLLQARMIAFGEDRKVDGLEINDFHVELCVLPCAFDEPLRNRKTDTPLAHAGDHHTELRHESSMPDNGNLRLVIRD